MKAVEDWEGVFVQFLQEQMDGDLAHDLQHVRRVVANAMQLAAATGARPAVVYPAAWLHDCVTVPKDAPGREHASYLAAQKAVEFLAPAGYPASHLPHIHHAIAAHSFSAGIPPRTLEAQVVQDADRLDALGAVGIARCLMLGAALGRPLYHAADPFCRRREPDERRYTLDHFYTKLLRLAQTMQTEPGRVEAQKRTEFIQTYLRQLAAEITP